MSTLIILAREIAYYFSGDAFCMYYRLDCTNDKIASQQVHPCRVGC